jgi:23S rRNA pseudouridine1911/1915/1917 synthase
MASIGHPVVGDTLYGAPALIQLADAAPAKRKRLAKGAEPAAATEALSLDRNFLHAAELAFAHPKSGKELDLHSPLPADLTDFLGLLEKDA